MASCVYLCCCLLYILCNDYRSYRDPEMLKNGVVEYGEVASYVKIRNLEHALEIHDLQAQLSLANHELFTYKTTTHIVAPALAVTIGFHTFLGQKERQSQACFTKAVGISLAASLFLIARSHLKSCRKSMSKNKNEIAKNNKQI